MAWSSLNTQYVCSHLDLHWIWSLAWPALSHSSPDLTRVVRMQKEIEHCPGSDLRAGMCWGICLDGSWHQELLTLRKSWHNRLPSSGWLSSGWDSELGEPSWWSYLRGLSKGNTQASRVAGRWGRSGFGERSGTPWPEIGLIRSWEGPYPGWRLALGQITVTGPWDQGPRLILRVRFRLCGTGLWCCEHRAFEPHGDAKSAMEE